MGAGSGWQRAHVPAGNYARDLVPALFAPWARHLVAQVRPRTGESVLDLACGTGVVARTAAAQVGPTGSVTGVDVSADMLDVARAGEEPIAWVCAPAERTGLPDRSFDVALCQQGLQFFPDRPAALAELHRVVAAGGRVALSVWCDPGTPGYTAVREALALHLAESTGPVAFIDAIFGLADAGELRALLEHAGFTGVRIGRRTDAVRFPSPEAWVRAFLGAAPVPGIGGPAAPELDPVVAEAAARLRHLTDRGTGLAFPLSAHTAVATRP
ncbi:methyltransferase domain-containing protein [Nocardiopsis sp. YSL2]|uniref:methyltransferase domain-containing protein n=1 Tax=Nocardiopsis sp. YSL2 TaxID=2939492 RepID=UPI0026F44880|nr:methyltransferase domain-containing protein [Nocardiopsis sp. YSL2]